MDFLDIHSGEKIGPVTLAIGPIAYLNSLSQKHCN